MEQIYAKLNEVFRDFFDDDEIVVTETTKASDIEGWDSLEHITLMATIEEEFGVKFDLTKKFENVGAMAKEIAAQLG